MKCFSYCSAGDYNLAELCQYLEQYFGTINYQFIGDILHCDYDGKHIFFFPYGCSVLWGTDENTNIAILKLLDHVSVDKLDKIICDIVTYKYDDGHLRDRLVIDEENDLITLESDDILLKFSVSYGLSQSVKLKEFEFSVSNTIDATGVSTNFGERFKQYQQKRNGQNLNANKYWAFLGTYYNLNEASRYFDMLKSKFPQLLGKNNPKIEKSNIGGRKLLRLKTGPFNSKLSASEVCSSLNKHNINCMVVN